MAAEAKQAHKIALLHASYDALFYVTGLAFLRSSDTPTTYLRNTGNGNPYHNYLAHADIKPDLPELFFHPGALQHYHVHQPEAGGKGEGKF